MEKKKKFLRNLARVLAIVTAFVCTLCMVIPSYADDTQTTQGAIIAEQAQKIEDYISTLGYGNLQLTAGEQLEIQQKTYADLKSYVWISSEYAPLGYYPASSTSINSVYNGGYTFTIRDQNGNIVASREWAVLYRVYLASKRDSMEFSFYQYSSGNGGRLYIEYDLTNNAWVRVGFSTTSTISTFYSMANGYSFDIQAWSPTTQLSVGDYAGFLAVNPSQLLALNAYASNEEVYNEGYNAGYSEGTTDGYQDGYELGEVNGYRDGYDTGLDEGYRGGYDDGMTQISLIDFITEILRAPMTLIENALNFDIFGINMSNAVKALVTMALLAVVVTIVWKAVK